MREPSFSLYPAFRSPGQSGSPPPCCPRLTPRSQPHLQLMLALCKTDGLCLRPRASPGALESNRTARAPLLERVADADSAIPYSCSGEVSRPPAMPDRRRSVRRWHGEGVGSQAGHPPTTEAAVPSRMSPENSASPRSLPRSGALTTKAAAKAAGCGAVIVMLISFAFSTSVAVRNDTTYAQGTIAVLQCDQKGMHTLKYSLVWPVVDKLHQLFTSPWLNTFQRYF